MFIISNNSNILDIYGQMQDRHQYNLNTIEQRQQLYKQCLYQSQLCSNLTEIEFLRKLCLLITSNQIIINRLLPAYMINLRGGGCGQTKGSYQSQVSAKRTINRELPSSLLSITQAKVKNLQSKILTIGDKAIQDEYLNTINWLDVNEYWYQRIPDDKSKMTQCINLLQLSLLDILEIVEQIIDGCRFIAYSLIRVANNFSRIMVVYYTLNPEMFINLDLSNDLKEKINSIKETISQFGETSLYYNGLQYESGITEACINICPVDNPEGRRLGLNLLIEIVKSAASLSPSEDLFSSLGSFALYGVKALYQKYKESNFKEMMTKCLFIEQFKWTIVQCVEKETFQIKSLFKALAKFYKNEVEFSKSWEVKYCWIKTNHWIMGYRLIVTQEMCNQQQIDRFSSFWHELITQQIIQVIDRGDHSFGAIVNENVVQTVDLSATNPIYSKLITYIRLINRIKTKLLNGSDNLPQVLQYHSELSSHNNQQQNEINKKVIQVQIQFEYFNLSNMQGQYTQAQIILNNVLTNMADFSELIDDFNCQTIDQNIVEDIYQQCRLISKELQELQELLMTIRISMIQFMIIVDNFNKLLLSDDHLRQLHSKFESSIRLTFIIREISQVLTEYQNSQTNNQQQNQEYQESILKYLQNGIQIIKQEQTLDQAIKSSSTQQIIQIMNSIQNNINITSQVDEFQQFGWKIFDVNSKSCQNSAVITLIVSLQQVILSFEKVDKYLEEIQKMQTWYCKLSFISLQYINKQRDDQQKQSIISYTEFTNLKIELDSLLSKFKYIIQQCQIILQNTENLDLLHLKLNKDQQALVPNTQQNKQILMNVITLFWRRIEILQTNIQNNTIQISLNQELQQIEGVLELQSYLIQQQEGFVQQFQTIIQRALAIDNIQQNHHDQTDLFESLKKSLVQTLKQLQNVQDHQNQFLQQYESNLKQFKTLFETLIKKDQSYLFQFIKLNDKLQLPSWNIKMLNEGLYKSIQLPKERIIDLQLENSVMKLKCEQYVQDIAGILQLINSNLDKDNVGIIKDLITNELSKNATKCQLSDQVMKELILKFNTFNAADSKDLNQIHVLSIKIIDTLKLISSATSQDQIIQQDQKSSNQIEYRNQQSFRLDINYLDRLACYKQNFQMYFNSVKQIIKYNKIEHKNQQGTFVSLQCENAEYLINLINRNFIQMINLECLFDNQYTQSQYPSQQIIGEKLETLTNLNYNQMIQMLELNQSSAITLESIKQVDDNSWRYRECQLFNILITQQKLIKQFQNDYGQQFIIFKAIETDHRIQKVLKSADFLLQQYNALEKYWKQQSTSIQQMISSQLNKLQQLQKQIQSQQPGKDRDQLLLDHQAMEQQINDQIENVNNIGSSLGITIAFIQDLKKELLVIQDQLKELTSKMNDMSLDIKFLIGKSPQQLLEIRMEKVLKQKTIDDARSVYVQLYTLEMEDLDNKKEAINKTPLFNSGEEQNGELDEFIKFSKQGSLLVHGPAGSGKSTAAKKVEEYLWAKYKSQQIRNWNDSKEKALIPIFIQLPNLKDPKFRALQETLISQYLFNDKQITDLQTIVQAGKIKLFIIMDSYDELNKYYIEQSLNITNKFDQWCGDSNYQILNTTRSEIFTSKSDYRSWFASTPKKITKDNFKEIRILPFEQKQRDNFYDQYCKLSLKQAIIDIYDILFEQNNNKIDTALIINDLWQQIDDILKNNNSNQNFLLDSNQIDLIIQAIKSQKANKIDLYKDQETHLRQQLRYLWSSNMYKENIEQLKIEHLVETPYMTNIVVQVLPQLIEQFSSQDHLKSVFIRNIEGRENYNRNSSLIKLKSNEIWDLLLESKSLNEYKITNRRISSQIISQIFKQIQTLLPLALDSQNFYTNISAFIQDYFENKKSEFNKEIFTRLLTAQQCIIDDEQLRSLFQIILDIDIIVQSIQQNQPTSYDFYQMFLQEYIQKQMNKLAYKQRNFQISKYLQDAHEYVQSLGTMMTWNQITSIEYKQKGIIDQKSENDLQEQLYQFFDDNAKHSSIKAQIRTSIPLKARGNIYSFFHKSIQEYLFAKSFIDLLGIMKQLQDFKTQQLFLYRRKQNYEKWDYSQISSYDDFRKQFIKPEEKLNTESVNKFIKLLAYLDQHFINKKIYSEEFFIGSINFIVSKIKQNHELVAIIMILLKITKLGANFVNCTSNCFHIIKKLQRVLFGEDLSGIHVKKISIRNINLRQANLAYSQFKKVEIDGVNLVNANLCNCNWQKLITNELPMLTFKSNIGCLAYSKDSTRLVTGSEDSKIRIWDALSGKQIGECLTGHSRFILAVSYSPDSKYIASAGQDNTVIIWDASTGKQIAQLNGHTHYVQSISYSPDGKYLASGSSDNTIIIWETQSKKQIGETLNGHTSGVLSLSYSPDGRFIASGGNDKTIRRWDTQSQMQIGDCLTGHTQSIYSVQYSPDGKFIVSGSQDKTIRIWDSQSGKQIGENLTGHASQVNQVCYSPDGKFIVSASNDETLKIWDTQQQKQVGETLIGHTGHVRKVAYSPDGKFIASASNDETVRIWDPHSGNQVGENQNGHTNDVYAVSYSPDGKLIVTGSGDFTIRIWDTQSGKQIGENLMGHTKYVSSVSYSQDGKFIVSGSGDKTLKIWDSQTGRQIGENLIGHTDYVSSVSISPDGQFIASGGGDTTVRIWDAQSGKQIGDSLTGHTSYIRSVVYSPDGKLIVSGSGNPENLIRIWDAKTGKQLGEALKGHTSSIWSISFSPDGRQIASGSSDYTIRIWDILSGKQIGQSLNANAGPICSVAYSRDGRFVATGCDDGKIRVWDIQLGKIQGGAINAHTCWVRSLSYSPDGKFIASGGGDYYIRIWDAQLEETINLEIDQQFEEDIGNESKVWLPQVSPITSRNQQIHQDQQNQVSLLKSSNRIKIRDCCVLRMPNTGHILYHGCTVLQSQIESRLGINVVQLWKDNQDKVE